MYLESGCSNIHRMETVLTSHCFVSIGMWDFRAPGFTAITHPASIKLAPNHGVFILEDMEGPWKKYNTGK